MRHKEAVAKDRVASDALRNVQNRQIHTDGRQIRGRVGSGVVGWGWGRGAIATGDGVSFRGAEDTAEPSSADRCTDLNARETLEPHFQRMSRTACEES